MESSKPVSRRKKTKYPWYAVRLSNTRVLRYPAIAVWCCGESISKDICSRLDNSGFTPTALFNGQNPTPPVVREMGLQIEPVDGRWGSE
jgi:hypothetical protein